MALAFDLILDLVGAVDSNHWAEADDSFPLLYYTLLLYPVFL